MRRREFFRRSAAVGLAAALPTSLLGKLRASSGARGGKPAGGSGGASTPLKPPAGGNIPVAFLVSEGAVLIDFGGPWEVFQDVYVPSRGSMEDAMPFRLFTVSGSTNPIRISGGLQIVPDYSFENAPQPKVIVIPAQKSSDAAQDWVRKASRGADVTMSVCTGAFLLAGTGLLAGKSATTHHSSYRQFAMQFPQVRLERGMRFVDEGTVASAGGLTSGIDLALHVVERYFGRDVATATAYQLEYQGQGWLNPASNAVYAKRPVSTDAHPLCPVCDMDVDRATAPKASYKGKTYYFCSDAHREQFEAAPDNWLAP